MNFFLDESGRFDPLKNNPSSDTFEFIAILIASDKALLNLEKQYVDKDKEFLRKNKLDVINSLKENNCKVLVIGWNANIHSLDELEIHRQDYIKSILETNHPEFLRESAEKHVENLKNLSIQDYVKTLLIMQLLENAIRAICGESEKYKSYDIQDFDIIFDKLSDECVPIIKYFSHFPIFCHSNQNPFDSDNKQNISHLTDITGKYLNVQKILQNMNFLKSKDNLGIRLVDVMVNQLYRIFNNASIDYNLTILKDIIPEYYGLDFMHFNKKKYMNVQIVNNAQTFLNTIPNKFLI